MKSVLAAVLCVVMPTALFAAESQPSFKVKYDGGSLQDAKDHEGGKDAISRDNKVVVFNRDGDAIMSKSTRMLGNAVKDA